MGATDGVIMPIIITAHMTNISNASSLVHGLWAEAITMRKPVDIIRIPVISMPLMCMSAARRITYIQASAVIPMSAANTKIASRRRSRCSALSLMANQRITPLWQSAMLANCA